MKTGKLISLKSIATVLSLTLSAAVIPALGQQVGPPVTTGRPTDWTHHRLFFSDPGTLDAAYKKGNAFQVQSILHNTRYTLQQMRRNPVLRPDSLPGAGPHRNPKPNPNAIHKDWSEVLSTGIVQPNAYPAKYSFSTTTFSCTADWVAYPTGIAGSTAATATIVSYNELYGTSGPSGTGCGAGSGGSAVPVIHWEYNTAYAQGSTSPDSSIIKTSPVLSLDGTQVAFIQVAGTTASLVLLKPSTSSSVVALDTATTNVVPSGYRACTAPCMTRIALNPGTHNDTWSAPFYDYFNDVLYVGDDSGELHKFTGVFISGTPTEAAHVALGATVLGSPVYDATSGLVFVGNEAGALYSVTASSMALSATSATLSNSTTGGIYDAPLVDSTAGKVYVFVAAAVAQTAGCTTAGQNCVYQFPVAFTGATKPASEPVGTSGTIRTQEHILLDGDFDNIYYSSTAGTAGNLYVVGDTDAVAGGTTPSLYRIPILGTGLMSNPVATAVGTNSVNGIPSPLTEFCNNGVNPCTASGTATTAGTDYIFFSLYEASVTGCTVSAQHGCVIAYNVTNGAPATPTVLSETYNGTFACWVTGGIVVDNAIPSGTEAGASEIYFMGLNGTATNLCGNAGGGSLTGVQSAQ